MAEGIYRFPDGFLWGTATSAHQVEGHAHNSWAHWETVNKGIVYENQQHGEACDWWGGRWEEDFERMRYLGHKTHRLSLDWARVEPAPGTLDEDAIEKYQNMLKGMVDRGIRPMVSLHHFTNPMWLEEEGGWLSSAVVDRFARWAEVAVDSFGDYVDLWCTFNEPMVFAAQAYFAGFFYPGRHNPLKMFRAAEMLLRAHAAAYHAIKAKQPDSEVGLAKHIVIFESIPPHFINTLPVRTVRRVFNRAFLEAMITGELKLPLRRKIMIPDLPGTYDYAGLNYYQRYRGGFSLRAPDTFFLTQIPGPDSPPSPPMWGEIYPQGMYETIAFIWKILRKPIYITETGTPDKGDDIRRWFIAHVVHQVWRAINFNIPVKGIY
ncbi:MAG: glycoside hydrolase family 1 protein, partial [Chloroflexi bacterium]|nr:glycoside hydrolase family 1 protein [Chloroflexota bacterium]